MEQLIYSKHQIQEIINSLNSLTIKGESAMTVIRIGQILNSPILQEKDKLKKENIEKIEN